MEIGGCFCTGSISSSEPCNLFNIIAALLYSSLRITALLAPVLKDGLILAVFALCHIFSTVWNILNVIEKCLDVSIESNNSQSLQIFTAAR